MAYKRQSLQDSRLAGIKTCWFHSWQVLKLVDIKAR
jgi:hypothetical protein